jgi:organic hydroperoxide reductase OsmC/OhrA
MSVHRATVRWHRTVSPFIYETYARAHTWHFPGGSTVHASAAPAFRGDPSLVDPEEAFVASLASCHLLTFLALAARAGHTVDAYDDEAEGVLAENADGRLAITRVVLRPHAAFSGQAPTAAEVARLHERAHGECFIANSVLTEVVVEPRG